LDEDDALVPAGVYSVWFTKDGASDPLVGPWVIDATEGLSYQFMMVGTKASNNKTVVIKQNVGTI
jgi:hypothetical protein